MVVLPGDFAHRDWSDRLAMLFEVDGGMCQLEPVVCPVREDLIALQNLVTNECLFLFVVLDSNFKILQNVY